MFKKYIKVTYLAPFSLIVATCGYFLTLKSNSEILKALHAFFEAAMVGGLADWFAVVALFRHPFGLPIPHTSIIIKNRHKITDKIVDMVKNQWLTKEAILNKINNYNFSNQILDILLNESGKNIKNISEFLTNEIINWINKNDTLLQMSLEKITSLVKDNLVNNQNLQSKINNLLKSKVNDIIDSVIDKIYIEIDKEENLNIISEKVRQILLSYFKNSELIQLLISGSEEFGFLNYDKIAIHIVENLRNELNNIKNDKTHFLRKKLENILNDLIENFMKNNFSNIMNSALDDLNNIIIETNFMFKLIENNKELINSILFKLLFTSISRFQANENAKDAFNNWIKDKISILINENHSQIGEIVRVNIDSVSDNELVMQLEERVGEDLQYIRINGAIVGGLVGLLIYLFNLFLIK